MQVFITGGTGLVGRRLIESRPSDTFIVLTRNAERARRSFADTAAERVNCVEGDITTPGAWQQAIDGCDALVHLAGAGIADKRWTDAYKRELVESRVESGNRLVEGIEQATNRPTIVIGASGVGIYGEGGESIIDESTPPADDFIARLCVAWEGALQPASERGARVVTLRIGPVLDPRGGALEKMVTPMRFFVGGPIGRGRFFMSWIHHADLSSLFGWCLDHDAASGAYNAVSPEPVRNRRFMKAIGAAIGRPSWLPAPPFALRILMGELADHVMASARVVPVRAATAGFQFKFASIEAAMRDALDTR